MLVRKITLGILFVAIVLLLASRTLDLHNWNLTFRDTQAMRVQFDLEVIRSALALYKAENGAYPSTDQGIAALVVKPTSPPIPRNWTQRLSAVPKDPWENEYFYLCPGRTNVTGYDLFSAGPDGKPYTADDDWGKSSNDLTNR